MPSIRIVALAAALALPAAAHAQPERITPGTPLDTAFVAPRTDSLAILAARGGDTIRVGTAVMETRVDSASGTRRVVHVQRLLIEGLPDAVVADSAHLHWSTLVPISAHTRGDTPADFHFGPGSVRIASLRDSTVNEVALAQPAFYAVADLLLRALPLRPGYRAVLPTLSEDGSPREMHVAVTGEETAHALDGAACPVLVVEVREEDFGGTFRISPVNRAIIRFDSEHTTLVRPAGCP